MNFAYNFITNLNRLKGTLLGQFAKVEDGHIDLDVSRHEQGDVIEERFYQPDGDEVVCRIIYEPNRITYYEPKTEKDSQDHPEEHEAVSSSSEWDVQFD